MQSGRYTVRGTLRDLNDPKKISSVKKAVGKYFDQLELVQAELSDEISIIKACSGAYYIVHTAAPITVSVRQDFETPCLGGTLSILKAATINKIKRLVITSSCSAVFAKNPIKDFYTPEDWSDLNNTFENGYGSAKTKAEKAAFDYVEKLPAEKKFEIVSICPSYTFGPAINDQPYEINELLVKKILLN